MLKRTIRAIRRQPKSVRDQYALWIAVVFTSAIAAVWLFSMFDGVQADIIPPTPTDVVDDAPESLGDMMDDLRDGLSELADVASSTTVVASSSVATLAATGTVAVPPPAVPARVATYTATTTPTQP